MCNAVRNLFQAFIVERQKIVGIRFESHNADEGISPFPDDASAVYSHAQVRCRGFAVVFRTIVIDVDKRSDGQPCRTNRRAVVGMHISVAAAEGETSLGSLRCHEIVVG